MGVGATECGKLEILTSSITLMNNQTDWSGLAGLGPLSVLLAGWEVRPVRAFLGAVALILGGCAAAQPSHWEKPGATQEAFMRDRYVCLQQTPQDRAGTTTRHCLPHAWERGDIKKTLTSTCPPPPRQLLGISADALPNLQSPSGRACPYRRRNWLPLRNARQVQDSGHHLSRGLPPPAMGVGAKEGAAKN